MRLSGNTFRRPISLGCGSSLALLLMLGGASTQSNASVLANPGFETPDASAGDQAVTPATSNWTGFGGAFITAAIHKSGTQAGKAFGGPGGMYQDFAAAPGQEWQGSVYAENASLDPLLGAQGAFVNIEWHDAGGGLISFLSTPIVNSATAADTWTFGTVQGIAPAGTATARLVLLSGPYTGLPGNSGGAAFFDDATFTQVPEPAAIGALALGLLAVRRRGHRA